MGKIKIGLVALYAVFCSNSVTGQGYITDARHCVEKSYISQIGIRERTGHNDGTDVEKYLHSVNLGRGAAWCAAFVNWNLQHCGIKTPKSAWSPTWFPDNKIIYKPSLRIANTPKTGDVFGIYFRTLKRIAHVGFIYRWSDESFVTTVEGNTSDAGSREGDGVYMKKRLKRQIYAVSRWID
jgi:hypothetical protein